LKIDWKMSPISPKLMILLDISSTSQVARFAPAGCCAARPNA